jgi:hypothetical protein
MSLPRLLVVSALLPLLGCAETQQFPASTPAVVFPSRTETAQIPAKPALPQVFGTTDVAVEEWNVESPPLPSDAPYDDPSPWSTLLRDLMKTRGDSVALSPAMRCAAAETARFHLKNRALPVENLRRFILARCGGETPNVMPFVSFVDAPAGVSDEQIIARVREGLANGVAETLAHGHHLVGLAAARDAKRASVAIVIGEDEARLEPGARSVDATRHLTLRGTARGDYAQITALVNRGDFGVSRCQSDPAVRAPRFALTCELAPGDTWDWVEVLGQKRGRVLLGALADVLVYEGDGSAIAYKAKSYGPPAPVTTPAAFTSALVDEINGVRQKGKLSPLTLAVKQSAENERLAGTILDAAVARNDDSADKAALGLLAGWDVVGGTIRGGQFFLGAVAPTNDATMWLGTTIERPIGRLTLLDPDARQIAVGPSILESARGLGAAVTTYALFETEDHAADEAMFLGRIKEARLARGLVAPLRIPTSAEVRKLTASVRREELTPRGALNEILTSVSAQSGTASYGYVIETNDLATVEVPDVFLKKGPLLLALTVTHHRAPGAAWGQYVVLAVLPGGEPVPSLQATRGRTGGVL